MALIQWNDSFRVNITELDHQRQQMITMINAMHQAMLQGTARESMGKAMADLLTYAGKHFFTEESFFDQYGYPDTASHKQEHKAFIDKVTEFRATYETRQLSLSITVMQYLYGWVTSHLKVTDLKYAPYLTSKGVK